MSGSRSGSPRCRTLNINASMDSQLYTAATCVIAFLLPTVASSVVPPFLALPRACSVRRSRTSPSSYLHTISSSSRHLSRPTESAATAAAAAAAAVSPTASAASTSLAPPAGPHPPPLLSPEPAPTCCQNVSAHTVSTYTVCPTQGHPSRQRMVLQFMATMCAVHSRLTHSPQCGTA